MLDGYDLPINLAFEVFYTFVFVVSGRRIEQKKRKVYTNADQTQRRTRQKTSI